MARSLARLSITSVAAITAVSALYAAQEPPREWIEPATGHRVIRLSDEPGTASLYFHQNPYTASGDRMVVSTPRGLATITLATRRIAPLVEGRVSHLVVGRKTRQAFYIQNDTVYATHVDSGVTRKILEHPRIRTGSGFGISADERLLAGSFITGDGSGARPPNSTQPGGRGAANPLATPPPTASSLETRWAERLPMTLYTLNIESGELKTIYQSTDWLNHVQMSPTDPTLMMFCHEGPWHFVDRIWTIRTDGSERALRHKRTMDMESRDMSSSAPTGRPSGTTCRRRRARFSGLPESTSRQAVRRGIRWRAKNGPSISTPRQTARCSRAMAEARAASRRPATVSGSICSRRRAGY